MAARADVNIVTQLGIETTPGTSVATTVKFPSVDVEFSPEHTKQFFRPAGQKFNTIGVMNKNWSAGAFRGPLNYTELAYILSSYSNYAAPSTVGTGGKGWTFNPALAAEDTIKTYTLERGDANDAAKIANAIFNSLDIEITRDNGTISGNVLGKSFSVGNTITAGNTFITNNPVSMNDMSVYLDSTIAGLGTTKLTDVFRLAVNLPDKYSPKWVVDAGQASWSDLVSQYMTPKLSLECEFSSQMRTLYNTLKADNVGNYFLRATAIGENIGAGADYTFRLSAALQLVSAKENRRGNGDVYAYSFDFEVMGDTAWGKAWEIFLTNALTAL